MYTIIMERSASLLAAAVLLIMTAVSANAQGKALLWEPVNIPQRNLIHGAGGTAMQPNLRRITFVSDEKGGNNLKFRIKDASGRVWVAKIADESQAEVAANRLLWAVGYQTEIDYLVPKLKIPNKKTHTNVRLEARAENHKRDGRWEWTNNPFLGTPEFNGLKLMMALINNWDLKDDNTAIIADGDRLRYVVSDLGSSFGRTAATSLPILTKFGRSVNNPNHYAKSSFIVGLSPEGKLDLAYDGKQDHLVKDFSVEDAQWLAALLKQLTDKQIADAFRAAKYSAGDVRLLTNTIKKRIAELDNPEGAVALRR
ncbi:MAG: hypothetical protein QUS14_13180 [Pyrinomonadaceae bacterium]|nr:hypothetical protein [Pyrinomonadaceae bacterium]